LEFIRKLKKIG